MAVVAMADVGREVEVEAVAVVGHRDLRSIWS